ncbi:MAG TPA: phage major capsid protein [Tepidisphaeraceae bacterium]|nr:phage major capsid protein [Tepidisphaeraceae bacterium]
MEYFSGFSRADLEKYSLQRAIRSLAQKRPLEGIERDVSRELAKRSGKPTAGIHIPLTIPTGPDLERRALDLTTGAGAVATTVDPARFIDALRSRTVCLAAGATIITGLVGNLQLPRESVIATPAWDADSAAPASEQNATLDDVLMEPHSCSIFSDLSRKFWLQSSLSAETFVKNDLARGLGVALDAAALNGLGTGNQPVGILQNGAIQSNPIGTNGGVPTYAQILALETGVAIGNADAGSLAYVTSPKVRGLLKTIPKVTGGAVAEPVWRSQPLASGGSLDYCDGRNAFVTNSIPSNLTKGTGTNLSAIIFGAWQDLVISVWGESVEVLIDPYTFSSSGSVRIVAKLECDIAVRHVESFHVISDLDVSSQPTS